MHDCVRDGFAHSHVNSKRDFFPEAATLDKARRRGSSVSDRLNVAGQNESSRLFGHKGHGLSCRELRSGCC